MPVQNNKEGNLRLDKVTKRFGAFTAVDAISLSIRAGDLFSILGPSGSGKTTVLRMIAGFEVPTSGKIFMGGEDITDLPPHKRQVNTIFQNYSLFPHLSVFENVAFGLKMKKVPPKQIKKHVDSMLDTANLLRHAGKYPHQISGGEKQRVAIIRALINKPQVLLLDEPVSALDPKLRQKMLVELINIHDQAGITFIYITHDQSEAMSISDRMALMNAGKIVQIGSPREVWEHPNSLFSASFLGDANLFTGKVTALEKDYITFRSRLDDYVLLVHSGFHIPLEVGQEVALSLRAEKVFISKERPVSKPGLNILSGYVEDIFYLGTHIQFIVRLGPRTIKVSAFPQHPGDDEETLTWNERVYVSWHATDSVIINELPGEG